MRAALRLSKHTPLIKFTGGLHKIPNVSHGVKAHPLAPNGILPSGSTSSSGSYFNPNPIEPKEGQYFSRSELPERFRYKPIKDNEIENVEQGGAELVF